MLSVLSELMFVTNPAPVVALHSTQSILFPSAHFSHLNCLTCKCYHVWGGEKGWEGKEKVETSVWSLHFSGCKISLITFLSAIWNKDRLNDNTYTWNWFFFWRLRSCDLECFPNNHMVQAYIWLQLNSLFGL